MGILSGCEVFRWRSTGKRIESAHSLAGNPISASPANNLESSRPHVQTKWGDRQDRPPSFGQNNVANPTFRPDANGLEDHHGGVQMLHEGQVTGLATPHLQGDAAEHRWGYALMLPYRES
jgi:hypothetical protein